MYDGGSHSPNPMTEDKSVEDRKALKREFKEFLKLIAWFLLLFLTLKYFVVEGYEVQGSSMQPTLQNGDRILVWKLPHKVSEWFHSIEPIQPGDVVVFDYPEDAAGRRYLKRVIARGPSGGGGKTVSAHEDNGRVIPDDGVHVRIDRGTIYVNNQRLDEPYLQASGLDPHEHDDEVVLAPGEYYVLGDNRPVSKDSRSFGAVTDRRMIGEAVFRFWPLGRLGPVN